MAERKWSNLIGNVTIRYTEQGLNNTIATTEQLNEVIQNLNQNVASISRVSRVSELADDLDLAKVSSKFAFESFAKFNQTLLGLNENVSKSFQEGSKHLKDTKDRINKVISAVRLAAKEGREDLFQYFTPEDLENLDNYSTQFEEFYELLEKADRLQKEYQEKQDKFKDSLIELSGKTLNLVANQFRNVFNELIPEGLGDAKPALDAFTSSFGQMFNMFKMAGKKIATLGKGGIVEKFLQAKEAKKKFGESSSRVKNFTANLLSMGKQSNKVAGGGMRSLTQSMGGLGATAGRTGGLLARLGPLMGSLANPIVLAAVIALAAAIAGIVIVLGTLLIAVKLAIAGWKSLIKTQEEFRTNAFRSMGTIDDLTNSVNRLGASTRLGSEAATESIKALNEAGISGATLAQGFEGLNNSIINYNSAMDDAAELTMKVAFITGVSEGEIAQFNKSMIEITGSVNEAKLAFEAMLQIQQDIGLSQKGLSKAMGSLVKQQATLQTVMTDTDAKEYAASLMGVYAAAEQAGVGLETVDNIISRINEGMNKTAILMAALADRVDEFMQSTDMSEQVDIQLKGIRRVGDMLMNMSTDNAQAQLLIAKRFGTSMEEIALARKEKELELNEVMKEALKTPEALEARFEKASNTMTQLIRQILNPLLSMASEAMEPLLEQAKELGDWIKTAINPLWAEMKGLITDIFGDLGVESDNLKSILKAIINIATQIVKAVRIIVGWVKVAWVAFSGLIDFAWGLWEAVKAVAKVLKYSTPLGWGFMVYEWLNKVDERSEKSTERQIKNQKDITAAIEAENQKRKALLGEDEKEKNKKIICSAEKGMPSYSEDVRRWWRERRGYTLEEGYREAGFIAESPVAEASEIPSVKYTNEMKKGDRRERLIEALVEAATTNNEKLTELIDKEDPNTEEAAKALKDMAAQSNVYQSHRRGSTMGSRSTQWNR